MRIQNDGINKMLNIYKNQEKVSETNKLNKGKKADQLNISSGARDFQLAMAEVKNKPEIREEKVAEIKKQIEAGTYEVNPKKIAEKMMQGANIYKNYK